ncbi:hypothetical protein lerEdw1_009093 [Lerista edwardsae]|nr:hypothetical protein lerEdw1_009093 [Lerista edwardsae]
MPVPRNAKSASNKLPWPGRAVAAENAPAEKEESAQAKRSPSSPQGAPKKRSAFGDITNAHKSRQIAGKKETAKAAPRRAPKAGPAGVAKNNELNLKKSLSRIPSEPAPTEADGAAREDPGEAEDPLAEQALPIEDVDQALLADPYASAEYAKDIFAYMREREVASFQAPPAREVGLPGPCPFWGGGAAAGSGPTCTSWPVARSKLGKGLEQGLLQGAGHGETHPLCTRSMGLRVGAGLAGRGPDPSLATCSDSLTGLRPPGGWADRRLAAALTLPCLLLLLQEKFVLPDYMENQPDITRDMRAILVDWMVEVQENFELTHETLYLAVKLLDHYLVKVTTMRDKLQLIGSTAILIASKFEERCPPCVDDFLYICDDAYKREELLDMEIGILQTLQFDINIPVAYRFLRRFAKCAHATMETLTLARFICELTLQDYDFVQERASRLAASCLLLALKMKNLSGWSPTLEHYSGYGARELPPLVKRLNFLLTYRQDERLKAVRSKYSHRVFFEVAKMPPPGHAEAGGGPAELTPAPAGESRVKMLPSSWSVNTL